MKIIINSSNLFQGGGIQVAYSFLMESKRYVDNEYHVFLCPKLGDQIDTYSFPGNYFFYYIPNRPSPITIKGIKTIKTLKSLEKKINPDCVFSVFGPTYWTPKVPHLMGFALGHFIYPDSPYFKIIKWKAKIGWNLLGWIKLSYMKKNAQYYHVETNDAKLRLSRLHSFPANNIHVLSNTHGAIFEQFIPSKEQILEQRRQENEFRIVCISSYYKHKNLEILNKVIPILINKNLNVVFILTIDNTNFQENFDDSIKQNIINVGPIPIKLCPQLYYESDAVFLPSLLEIFSANYPEAMKMEKPILTSDLSFAKDICGDAALFFNPLSEMDIANKIEKLVKDKDLQNRLTVAGKKRLSLFPTPIKKAQQILEICQSIM